MGSAKRVSAMPEQLHWSEITPKALAALSPEERIVVQRALIQALLLSNDEVTKARACRLFVATYRATIYSACVSVAEGSHRDQYRHRAIALGVGTTQIPGSPRPPLSDHCDRAIAYLVVGLRGNANSDVKYGGSPLKDWLDGPRSDLKPFIWRCVRNHLLDLLQRDRKKKRKEFQVSPTSGNRSTRTHFVDIDPDSMMSNQTGPADLQEPELDSMLENWWTVYETWLAKRRSPRRDADIIEDVVGGLPQASVAAAHNITPAAVSQLLKAFYELYADFWGAEAPVLRTRTK